jgi:DNA polymerase I-like protein with 3'-5' exonuclease and polymerase domains
MYAKKAGATLNVIPDEGRIVIDTIKAELPRTFTMVEQASLDAERQGYVVLNNRTNSRAWFPFLIKQLRGEINKQTHFLDISGELSAARNIRIQGTQADFVKEATVVLWKFINKNNLDIGILSWVHDEIVFRLPRYLDGHSQQWIDFISYNPNFILTSPTTGKEYDNLKDTLIDIMVSVANRYLINVEISVEAEVEDNWIK